MDAGIDITVFTPHSTRAASTSKANNLGLSIKDIAKAAGWKGGSTFQRYYKFPITKKEILQDNLNNGTCYCYITVGYLLLCKCICHYIVKKLS